MRARRRSLFGLTLAAMLLGGTLASRAAPGDRPSPTAPCAVMLDESLSMAGFYGVDGESFAALIDAFSRRCPESWLAGISGRPSPVRLSAHRPEPVHGRETRLGTALGTWLDSSHSGRLILLTDNVADSGRGVLDDEQSRFYELLRAPESQLTHISMLILRPRFQGPVYGLNDEQRFYPGPNRALTIYVLERRGRPRDETFLRQVEEVVRSGGYTPYGGTGTPRRTDYAVARLSPFRPGVGAANSGMTVEAQSGGRNVRLLPGKAGIRVARGGSDRETRFALRRVEVTTGPEWDFGTAPFSARIDFPASPDFGPALQGRCDVVPPRSQPGLNRRIALSMTCTVPAAAHRLTPEQQDRLVVKGSAVRGGTLTLAIETQGRELSLRGPLQAHFGMAADVEQRPDGLASILPEVQERVYRLPELLANTIPAADRTVVVKRFPLEVEMTTPPWGSLGRALARWLPLLLVLLILGVIAWLATRPATYALSGAEGMDRLKLTFGARQSVRTIEGGKVELRLLGPALLTQVGTVRKFLRRSGGDVRDKSNRLILRLKATVSNRTRGRATRGRGSGRSPRPPRR